MINILTFIDYFVILVVYYAFIELSNYMFIF